ncbi:metalloregulator ArsR/SmtB family transcription factor [Phytoactinopolyspora sp. XMNu-373]|uniref:Metalloregulator ArsR/SmtB family transcription factor n=1 Tax=Phytoactinopolyspora mesophila TaxID=2650750 RepID=A0A7K3M6B1_9ACTN|nr:metalloregulator ArsR/SmtB family transcription factor [Phytoactinopolyspora mesophila]NDL58770.1 metalloregulator ArsR/SmtB family transcription factor [Phytoactinopolyspora mesophila]
MAMNRTLVDGGAAKANDQAAVLLFHSLADPVRLSIIRLLADGERRVVDLTRELGLAQSTVSGHLACLRSAGLIDAHPHGRSTFYELAKPQLWPLLSAAEQLLNSNGSAVTLCPEHRRSELAGVCGAVRGCVLHGAEPESAVHDQHDHTGAYLPGAAHQAPSKRPGRH